MRLMDELTPLLCLVWTGKAALLFVLADLLFP